jgi:hypothetical protein
MRDEDQEAAELRDRLDREPFVVALRAAWSPRDLSGSLHEKLVNQVVELGPLSESELEDARATRDALAGGTGALLKELGGAPVPATIAKQAPSKRQPRLRVIAGGVTGLFAAAAAALLLVRAQPEPDWLPSRSTSNLFAAPFTVGERSGRVDVIARGRASDFRENQFLAWGVK